MLDASGLRRNFKWDSATAVFFALSAFFTLNVATLATIYFRQDWPINPIVYGVCAIYIYIFTPSAPSTRYITVGYIYFATLSAFGMIGYLARDTSLDNVTGYQILQMLLKTWINLIGLPFLALRVIGPGTVRVFLLMVQLLTSVGAILAPIQMLYPEPFVDYLGEVGRGAGVWVNPNNCGAMCVIAGVVSIACPPASATWRWLTRFSYIFGLASSLSRAAILAAVFGILVYLVARRRVKQAFLVTGVLLTSVLLLPPVLELAGDAMSLSEAHQARVRSIVDLARGDTTGVEESDTRSELWRYAWDAVQSAWLFGLGHGSMERIVPLGAKGLSPHNYYLYVWGTSGVFALGALFLFLCSPVFLNRSDRRRKWRAIVFGLSGVLMLLLVFDTALPAHQWLSPLFVIICWSSVPLNLRVFSEWSGSNRSLQRQGARIFGETHV